MSLGDESSCETAARKPERRLRVAVIGAGLAGLTAARVLARHGHEVVVLEKARGPGGRMSTRREGSFRFDHGAQYFTARDPQFAREVRHWQALGVVRRWDASVAVVESGIIQPKHETTERYVGVPGMNAICRQLAQEQADCRLGWEVRSAERHGNAWCVKSANGQRLEADVLLVTAPPEQSRALLRDPAVDEQLGRVRLLPCWAVMMVLDRPLLTDWDAAFVNTGALSWIAAQRSKPDRPHAHAWVLHATTEWSRANLEAAAERVCDDLIGEALVLPGARHAKVGFSLAHRWRYSLAEEPLSVGALWFPARRLAIAGDWCSNSRVEGAFLSGTIAARHILETLSSS